MCQRVGPAGEQTASRKTHAYAAELVFISKETYLA